MPIDINQQLRHVPYRAVQSLVACLEPQSNKDWLALIRSMPDDRFSQNDIEMMKLSGSKQNKSCTECLWKELCHLCVTVKELGMYLKRIKNYDALKALEWPHEPVTITVQPCGEVVQENQNVCVKVSAIGYPLPEYQWYKNDEKIQEESTYELKLFNVSLRDSGKYKCIISNEMSSCTSHEVTVQVMKKPTALVESATQPEIDPRPCIITQPLSQPVLLGSHYILQCKAIGKEPLSYVWYKDGQQLLNTNTPNLEIRLFSERDAGVYLCKISNDFGDAISEQAELSVGTIGRELRQEATDKLALLIGNQDYSSNFPDGFQGQGVLQHAIADTKTLGSLLHQEEMGFNVLSYADLRLSEMKKAVETFLSLLSEGCYVVLYFAGHGFELNGKHYLVPVDSPVQWTQEDAVCIQWILESIWKRQPQLTVVLLDMCRVRPPDSSKAFYEDYDFPTDLKIVMGFATCSQSESYERIEEENGIYMKHLKNHICRDTKIEDILHDVTTDVTAETTRCRYTDAQRPEYVSKGGGYYSLRDPLAPNGSLCIDKWLDAHKLPGKRLISFDQGVQVQVSFQHCEWLTNAVNILVDVVNCGQTDTSYAYVHQIPNAQLHFSEHMNIPENQKDIERRLTNSRSWPSAKPIPEATRHNQPSKIEDKKPTAMCNLQRLFGNLTVTIAVTCELHGEKTTEYKVEVFPAQEFGLTQVFQ